MKSFTTRVATASVLAFASASGMAAYPEKPIEMIVAFDPGGGTDVAARSIASYMEKHLPRSGKIVVINKPGAGGELGFTQLAQAKPDGYTIGFINAPAIIAYTIERKTRYQMSEFRPIGNIVQDPNVWFVRSDNAFKTVNDVIEFAKKTPGALTLGTTGSSGSSDHIALMQLEKATGTKFNHVPFGGTAPARTALLGGHIPLSAGGLSELTTLQKEGKIRILGVMSENRSSLAPEIPTFKEQGVNILSVANRGLAAPKDVPDDVLKVLEQALEKAMKDPEYVDKAGKAGIPLDYMNASTFKAHLDKIKKSLDEIWASTPWK